MNFLSKGVSWGALNHLVYFPLVLMACGVILIRYRKKMRAWALLAGQRMMFLTTISARRQRAASCLFAAGLIALFCAFLRPQWNTIEETVMQEGRDLYIALDISKSMLAVDVEPNRLSYAKNKIKRLIKKLASERIGLILFSGSAFVQCPLTSDVGAFLLYLDSVDAELISSGTTALDKAIEKAIESFARGLERKNKLLVLFTDGEDFSHDLARIKQDAIKNNVSIFTMGVGTADGAPVPVFDIHGMQIGHQKDAQGSIVISRLNAASLHTLSRDAGGKYIHPTSNDNDINTLVAAVSSREKELLGEQKQTQAEDHYHYFLAGAFVLILIEWLL